MNKIYVLILALFAALPSMAQIGGFNLTENTGFNYDAAPAGQSKKPAQTAVDEIKRLGGKHVILNVRAIMKGPRSTEIVPVTPPAERASEAKRMIALMKYIKEQGLTVGIRPIFFVVGPNGEFPYFEKQADGTTKTWWHGNIQPSDPNRWFESFRTYLDQYITISSIGKADEFTVGAELYSMTVGVEDQWKEYPYGFPGRWLSLLRYVKTKLPKARLMYDINFTDDSNTQSGFAKSGGELERWRYRLVDLANPSNEAEAAIWNDLVSFWKELDAVGIDMYRSLASKNAVLPIQKEPLIATLKERTDSLATQLDNTLTEISLVTELEKPVIFKEIGFKSVDRGFIDPFDYASANGQVNMMHQSAAFEAFLSSFWDAKWPWFSGVIFWDIAVDPALQGTQDKGFSPLQKPESESVIIKRFAH